MIYHVHNKMSQSLVEFHTRFFFLFCFFFVFCFVFFFPRGKWENLLSDSYKGITDYCRCNVNIHVYFEAKALVMLAY